jgi:hypothetical protein
VITKKLPATSPSEEERRERKSSRTVPSRPWVRAALEEDLGPLISEREAVSGEKTIGTMTQPITAGEKAFYEMEWIALAHLTKTCTGSALHYISQRNLTAHEMWTILTVKDAISELLLDFTMVKTTYKERVLAPGEDLDLFLDDLELPSTQLEKIDTKYKKDDLTLRVHVMSPPWTGSLLVGTLLGVRTLVTGLPPRSHAGVPVRASEV